MAIGSIFLGGVADKIGRRPTILGCLVVMAIGMLMATTVSGLVDLSIWRIVTGLGIGGMLAAINAVAAEFSNTRRRDLSVSLMSIGYPVGAVLGGLVAAQLLRGNDWRTVFYFGAGVTAVLIPVVYFVVPESVHWLARKQPAGALERINAALRRMGHADGVRAARHPGRRAQGIDRRDLPARARGDHDDRHAGVLLPHHDLLLHREVDPEDRRGHGLRAVDARRACWSGPTSAARPAARCSGCSRCGSA